MKSEISVIMPVCNDERDVRSHALSILDRFPAVTRLFIVDAAVYPDGVSPLRTMAGTDVRIHIIEAPGAYPGAARNRAISRAPDGIIVHLDGGCRPADGWLEALCEPLLSNAADYVTGEVLPMKTPTRWFGFHHDAAPLFFAISTWGVRSQQCMAGGASVAYCKWVWEKAAGMPEWLRAGEDVLFARKVRLLGIRHCFAPDSICYWQVGPRIIDVLRRKYRYTAADMRLTPAPAHLKATIGRLVFFAFLLCTAAAFHPALPAAGAAALLLIARSTYKAIRRYYSRAGGSYRRLPPHIIFAIMPLCIAALYLFEAAGVIRGLPWRFARRKENRALIQQYLIGGHT